MRYLKQSTAFTLRIGPFLDSTDGVTAETGLSIAQADIQISKNGGAFAQTSDASPTTTHDTDGWYQCPLTATDTDTLGPLTVQIVKSGALPVWEHFTVVPANVYDSLVSGSDKLEVDTTLVEGSDATDQINAAADTALTDYDAVVPADLPTNFGSMGIEADGHVHADVKEWIGTAVTLGSGAPDVNIQSTDDIDLSATQKASVNAEADTALTDYDPPTNAEMEARTILAASYFDPSTDEVDADVVKISGDATAADRLEALMDGLIVAQVNDASATTTAFAADGFTEATDDHFIGRLITFITGDLAGQQTDITDYDAAGGTQGSQEFTVTALTSAPADGDFFVIH